MAQPTSLIVCPTSHMDWDWKISFEQYYKQNTVATNAGQGEVQQILDAAISLFNTESRFSFSVAELGWIQRYLVDQGGTLPSAPDLTNTLCLMGGAITSPDNLVCDGEVFVRTYLVGQQWARAVGLGAALANVAWVPDDFGHDPELPVILSAMGLTAVGFSRVPGAFPLFALPLPPADQPSVTPPSLACALMAEGVAFNWLAGDGSTVFAHFMPNTYGVPFWSQGADGSENAQAWEAFVQSQFLTTPSTEKSPTYSCPAPPPGVTWPDYTTPTSVAWPGGIAFAPAGGDFSIPDSGWVSGVVNFNRTKNGTNAKIGTFLDYVAAASAADIATRSIDPSNFWTGYFGSRPELKILQARASRELLAAEMVSSLLWLGGTTSSAALDALDTAIGQVWSILAPSSHHDFVTGTSPDGIYQTEQLPMLSLADKLAQGAYRQAVQFIAESLAPSSEGRAVAVHNPVGVARGGVFKLERGSAVSFGNRKAATVQPLADGELLVQSPEVPSLGYVSGTVTFGQGPPPPPPVFYGDELTIDNDIVSITVSQSQLWAITSIVPKGGANLLPTGAAANLLQVYDDTGNLYQYGNEPMGTYPNSNFGSFAPKSDMFTAGLAKQTEFGPLRWRVEAELTEKLTRSKYRLVYTLVAGESLVRMSVTGRAPSSTTVVTTFPAIATDGATKATRLTYGTAHHYHEDTAPAYWTGPTFKATHNFLMPSAVSANDVFPLAAIYHDGMPAWACDQGTLLGSLFRNTPGGQRGAWGTDGDTHTQRYALRISTTALDPSQGTPLVEALQFANPLRAAVASAENQPDSSATLPSSASLASAPSPALVRVARPMGEVKSPSGTCPQGRIALRLYRPDANCQPVQVQVTLPVLTESSNATAVLVTALEQPITDAPAIIVDTNVLTVPTSLAISTIEITAARR